ncbi:MAG: glycerophosphodiester phosphodiesterase family protein [Pseudomonadota bacterium]
MHRLSLLSVVALVVLLGCSDSSDDTTDGPSTSLTVFPTAVPEGSDGEQPELAFKVTLREAQSDAVTVSYRTEDVSAIGGDDYLTTEGRIDIPAGELTAWIYVPLIGDSIEEPAETFQLVIETTDNGIATNTSITGTIANDDSACNTPFSVERNPWRTYGEDPLHFAHRGGVIDFPENTLYAYSEAALAGADVLEMDVYQTLDNELVILHDLDVDRTTNGQGNVADLTLAELRQLDAAYWFVPGQGTPDDRPPEDYVFRGVATGDKPPPPGYSAEDFRIPTLEEALQRFPRNLINLELKPDLDGEGDYERQMAELLQRYGRSTDLIAVSFVDSAANAFKAAAPCVHTAIPLDQGTELVLGSLGEGTIPPVPEHITWQVPPDTSQIGPQIPDDFFLEVVTEDFIRDSHAVNLGVHVWTINRCEDMLRMIELGVDGIMTDRPVLLEELLNTPPEQRSCGE